MNQSTVSDDEVRALLASGMSVTQITKEHRVGMNRVRAIRDGRPIALKCGVHADGSLGNKIMAWLDENDLLGLGPTDRARAIMDAFGVSRSTGARWDCEWRRRNGVEVGPDPAGAAGAADDDNDDNDEGARDIGPGVRAATESIGNGDTVEIPANYLAALEAVVILTHLLNAAREGNT